MKLLGTVLVAALVAFGAGRWAGTRARHAPEASGAEPELARIRDGVKELWRENERLAARLSEGLERRTGGLAAAAAPPAEMGEAEIGAALERWRAAQAFEAPAARKPGRGGGRVPSSELDLATIPIQELVVALANEGLTNFERQELFQKLREAGRIDEYVAAIEKLAAEDPENAELQVALGHAYLQKLFGVDNAPEQQGILAFAADAAFDRALELDDGNWSARFSKAVALSNWPAFMGRGPEAIEHFELLLEQQGALPKRPEFAMTYLFLGNLLKAGGERGEALATWRAGLELFPDVEDLRRALELAASEPEEDRKR
jgi:tetratricopeptide (TPR) repeat protein